MSASADAPAIQGSPVVILVEPQMAENIGMAARAMLNCGLTELRLVRPDEPADHPRAIAAATGSGSGSGSGPWAVSQAGRRRSARSVSAVMRRWMRSSSSTSAVAARSPGSTRSLCGAAADRPALGSASRASSHRVTLFVRAAVRSASSVLATRS